MQIQEQQLTHYNLINQKTEEAKQIRSEYNSQKSNYDRDIAAYLDESIRLKDTLDHVLSTYKKTFDLKKFDSNLNSLNNFNMFF